VRLLFAGTPAVAVPSLVALIESSHEVVAVLTRPDAAAGRGQKTVMSPIGECARDHGIEVMQPVRVSDDAFLAQLADLAPDCCPIVAFGGLVPPKALLIPRAGWVNLHFSLLPAWRGAAPVQHAVLHGDEITGVSTFLLDDGLDTGPVFGSVTEEIRGEDTSGELMERLADSGANLLVRTLDGIASGELVPLTQPSEGVSLAPKLKVSDARVTWSSPALHIDRMVRACTPVPGAWTTFRDDRIKISPLTRSSQTEDLSVGRIAVSKDEVLVGTGSHAVCLGQVQPQGKRAMAATDWARGMRVESGELLV
jgi:methionyl-tRNA formyltransferase